MFIRFTFILLPFFATLLYGSEIVELSTNKNAAQITHKESSLWEMNEYACVYVGKQKAACGQISATTMEGSVLRFFPDEPSEVLEPGLQVVPVEPSDAGKQKVQEWNPALEFELLPIYKNLVLWGPLKKETEESKKVASLSEVKEPKTRAINSVKTLALSKKKDRRFNITAGINWLNPSLSFEFRIQKNWTLGISPGTYSLSSSGFTSSLLGARLTVNYFPYQLWEGLWLQSGVGLYTASSSYSQTQGNQTAQSFFGSCGWRMRWNSFNMGLALGAQYFNLKGTTGFPIGFNSLNPTILFNLGWLL